MAAYDYSGLQATAANLIARFGRSATLAKLTTASGTAYDPGDPTEVEYAVTICEIGYKQSERDGTLVEQNDRRVMMDSTVAPTSQDRIIDGSDEFVVVSVEAVKPGPAAVMYTVQLRA